MKAPTLLDIAGLRSGVILMLVLLVSGCATNQPQSSLSQEQSDLYEGKAILSFMAEQQAKTPEEAIKKAQQAQQSGDIDRALYQYIRAYELDNQNTSALIYIGYIHFQRKNYETSLNAFQRALNIDTKLADAHKGTGMIYLYRKSYSLAKESLTQAVELYKDQEVHNEALVEAYTGLGIINDLYGQYDQSKLNYYAAIKLSPKNPIVLNNLGYSYYMQQMWFQAEAEFKKALHAENNYKPAWKNLGLTYARQENYPAALDALEQVMKTAEAYNDIGYICMISERYTQAAYFFRKAISENPQYYKTAQQNLTRVKRLLDRDSVSKM